MKNLTILLLLVFSIFIGLTVRVEAAEKPVAIFYSPHQDDELLTMGVAIINHINAGYDVHVVLLTDGSASNVLGTVNKRLKRANRPPLTLSSFVAARNVEFIRSNMAMGVAKKNVHIEKLKDGRTSKSQIVSIMRKYNNLFPGAANMTMSYIDDHIDHANAGEALFQLYNEGKIKDARFYIQKDEFAKNPKLNVFSIETCQTGNCDEIKTAADSYMTFNPQRLHFAIGYTSVKAHFDEFLSEPISYYHMPYENF